MLGEGPVPRGKPVSGPVTVPIPPVPAPVPVPVPGATPICLNTAAGASGMLEIVRLDDVVDDESSANWVVKWQSFT